jgi:putative ABC transport system substrate-binding protein
MIGRRWFATSLAALTTPRIAVAQPSGKTWRLGVLDWSSAKDRVIYDGLVMALRDIGYVEGRNIVIEYRGADGDPQQAQRFATELVGSQIDLLIALSTPAAHAAKRATQTIPIVFHPKNLSWALH